jgi:hypothetical protein
MDISFVVLHTEWTWQHENDLSALAWLQVCLRWALQRGAVIAAGTGNKNATVGSYAKENLALYSFGLTGVDSPGRVCHEAPISI